MPVTLLILVAVFALMASRSGRRWHGPDRFGAQETRRELEGLRREVEDLSARFHRLETERDFYRDLLEPGAPRRAALGGDTLADAEQTRSDP